MKTLKKASVLLSILMGMTLPLSPVQAQPVFDLPVTEFMLSGTGGGQAIPSIASTLNVGDIEMGILNPITGEPLNDVALVFNPPISIGQGILPVNVRFYTIYHTSDTDTRALMASAPADLTYPADNDHIPFFFPTSVQILDLNRDGQNDLAFNGTAFDTGPSPWDEGPTPVLGVAGTGSDPFVGGNVDMVGRTLSIYNFPLWVGFETYGGMPSLATGDMNG
ncbi:MAG: hypothetical protein R3257_06910, partial [bacterium]|nr:hypothetical protein [bacterium]